MTKEIKDMTKEELINGIVETEKKGNELEELTCKLVDKYNELVGEYNNLAEMLTRLENDYKLGVAAMEDLALAQAMMRKRLEEEFGTFVL